MVSSNFHNKITANPTPISTTEFRQLRDLIYKRSGIDLADRKKGLLVTRLSKHLRTLRLTSFQDYYEHVIQAKNQADFMIMLDAISTNHTFFFREKPHFDFFSSTILPSLTTNLRGKGELDLRIWCAASSSGEEPYTIMMLVLECLKMEYSHWQSGLLATDISQSVLATAREGIYREDQVEMVPAKFRNKYFHPLPGNKLQIIPRLRQEVTYRIFNLMTPRLPFRKPFHIIFCRNVLIYFDQKTVQQVINKFYEVMVPGGYLFVGHSESLARIDNPFEYNIHPAVYQKAGPL